MSTITFQECGHADTLRAMLRVYDRPRKARVVVCIYPDDDPSDLRWVSGPRIVSWDREGSSIVLFCEPLTVVLGWHPAAVRLIDDRGVILDHMAWIKPNPVVHFMLAFSHQTTHTLERRQSKSVNGE